MGLFTRREVPQSPRPLPVGERCDQCPAAARVWLGRTLVTAREADGAPCSVGPELMHLAFCPPHYKRHETTLRERGWQVLDDQRGRR